MISLNKAVFSVPPQIRQKLFSCEYQRVGGIIKNVASGSVTYLLVDRLDTDKESSSISVSMPDIMDSTLRYLTAVQMRKQLEQIERELDSWNIRIKPEDLSLINETIDHVRMKDTSALQLQEITDKMLALYLRYREIFLKYLKDLDRPNDLQSFPFLKLLLLIATHSAKLCMQSSGYAKAGHWIKRVYDDTIEAMKVYCLLNSKTETDQAHYRKISGYQPREFISELQEVITSPPEKPKYKFPPMEVVYLWNCLEYLEGYLLELAPV